MICAAFDGIADPAIAGEVDAFRRVSLARPGSWARFLRRNGCREAILVGRVKKQNLHRRNELLWVLRQLPDAAALWTFATVLRKDRRTETALLAVADLLERRGITLTDSTAYTRDHLATAGIMGRVEPGEADRRAMERGWHLCGLLTGEDVGQALAVLDRDVIAVEAAEGTDAMIERAASLCRRGGWTLVKRGNTRRDPRFDVPVIGVRTIERLAAAKARCVLLEAGHVMLMNKSAVLAAANAAGIAVVGRAAEEP